MLMPARRREQSNADPPGRWRDAWIPNGFSALPRGFYDRHTEDVALDMLGTVICHKANGNVRAGRIVEVEAYLGVDDPACHISGGRFTQRTTGVFGSPGRAYVFITYGLYECLNATTLSTPPYGCVLIRAVEPWDIALDALRESCREPTSGPGLVSRYLRVNRRLNGAALDKGPVVILDTASEPKRIHYGPRIGISRWKEQMLRFYDADSSHVSRR